MRYRAHRETIKIVKSIQSYTVRGYIRSIMHIKQ